MIQDKNVIVLLNKSDLETKVTKEMIQEHLDKPMIEIQQRKKRESTNWNRP